MPGLDNMEPEMGQQPQNDVIGTHGEADREGAMAKADLFKLANYAHKLYQQIDDEDQLEAWVQAKITKAADYIASVYHYLEYEMKFSEYGHHLDNSDTLSEGQKMRLQEMLSEAKDKMKDLKKTQVEKIKEKKVSEGVMTGGEQECAECGGTGVVNMPGIEPSERARRLADKHATHIKGIKAALNRETAVDEETSSTGGTITKTKTGLRHQHNPARFSDEPHAEPASKVKARSAADKAGEKAMDKADEKESKAWGKANPGKQTIMKGGVKTTNEAKKKGDGNLANNAKPYDKVTRGDVIAGRLGKDEKGGKTVKEAAKWRDPKYKDKLYTQEPRDPDDYYQSDDDYYNPKPDDYPGAKHKIGGSEYDHNDPLRQGYGRYGVGSLNTHGKRKGMPSRDHITSLKGSIKDAHGTHPHPNLPEAAPRGQRSQDSAIKVAQIGKSKSPGANLKQGAEDALEKGNHKKIDQMHQYATTTTPTGRAKKVSEAKPSAGLSAAKKSAVVKDAKAGKDIGKPGKSFKDVAKKAGGGEKGEKIAAAAMWKNIKETTAYIAEKAKATKPDYIDLDKDGDKTEPMKKAAKEKETVKESADLARMRQLMTRLNG
jgi:hypothetical protein